MENVGQIKTVQVLRCILRRCNVISGILRGMKLVKDINAPIFQIKFASLVFKCGFLKQKQRSQVVMCILFLITKVNVFSFKNKFLLYFSSINFKNY